MSGRGSTGAGASAGAGGGSPARRPSLSRAAPLRRARAARSGISSRGKGGGGRLPHTPVAGGGGRGRSGGRNPGRPRSEPPERGGDRRTAEAADPPPEARAGTGASDRGRLWVRV